MFKHNVGLQFLLFCVSGVRPGNRRVGFLRKKLHRSRRALPTNTGACRRVPVHFFVIFNTRSDIGGVRDFLEVHKLERVLPIMVGTSLFENLNSMPCTGMLQHCTQPRIRRARYAHHVTSKFQHWRSARGLQHRVLCCSTRPGTVWSSKTHTHGQQLRLSASTP